MFFFILIFPENSNLIRFSKSFINTSIHISDLKYRIINIGLSLKSQRKWVLIRVIDRKCLIITLRYKDFFCVRSREEKRHLRLPGGRLHGLCGIRGSDGPPLKTPPGNKYSPISSVDWVHKNCCTHYFCAPNPVNGDPFPSLPESPCVCKVIVLTIKHTHNMSLPSAERNNPPKWCYYCTSILKTI